MSKPRVVVVGGGPAGVAAASLLAERGADVTLLEREDHLGGRAGATSDCLRDGTPFELGRGLHGFFRHYEQVRALLRRVDPGLSFLQPLDDVPVLGLNGHRQSLAGFPKGTFKVVSMVSRAGRGSILDLLRSDWGRAAEMLSFHPETTYRDLDGTSAKAFLDRMKLPADLRRSLFSVFCHALYDAEEETSAAELVASFHFHFATNDRGLVYDVATRPLSEAVWRPFERYLENFGVELLLRATCERIERAERGFRISWRARGLSRSVEADAVVLATTVAGLKQLTATSPDLNPLRPSVDGLAVALPCAVLKLWLDRPCSRERAPVVRTENRGLLHSVAIQDRFDDASSRWASATRGSVVELQGYAIPAAMGQDAVRESLHASFRELYPEIAEAKVLDRRFFMNRDWPAFQPGSYAKRPTVTTPIHRLVLAGDFVRLPFPSALMERAVSSGMLAANELLAGFELPTEPVSRRRRR